MLQHPLAEKEITFMDSVPQDYNELSMTNLTRAQRYIARIAETETEALEIIAALPTLNWTAIYKSPIQEKKQRATRKESRKQREEVTKATSARIQELQAMPYNEYLKTKEWNIKRHFALVRAKHCCQLCYASNIVLNVHHRTYERLGYEMNSDLIVLCSDCHTKHHDKLPDMPPRQDSRESF